MVNLKGRIQELLTSKTFPFLISGDGVSVNGGQMFSCVLGSHDMTVVWCHVFDLVVGKSGPMLEVLILLNLVENIPDDW